MWYLIIYISEYEWENDEKNNVVIFFNFAK